MPLSLFHLHGDLRDLSFPRLLATLGGDQFTGVFQATTGAGDAGGESSETTREVHFLGGHIAWAISTQKEESLRAYMLRNGSLTESQWAEAEQQARGGTVRDALITLELVNARELTQIEKGRAEEILLALFCTDEGEYRIRERQLPPGTPDLKIDPRPLILKGVLEKCDHGLVMEEVGSLDAVFSVKRTVLDEMTPHLPGEFQSVLKHVDGRRSIARILSQTSLPDNFVCSVLAALSMTGAIKRQPDKSPVKGLNDPKELREIPVEQRETSKEAVVLPTALIAQDIEAIRKEPVAIEEEPQLVLEEDDVYEEPVEMPAAVDDFEDELEPDLPPITLTPFTETGTIGAEFNEDPAQDVEETSPEREPPMAPSWYSSDAPRETTRPWFLLGGGAAVGLAALLLILMSHDTGDAGEVLRPVSQASPVLSDSIPDDRSGAYGSKPYIREEPDTTAVAAPIASRDSVAPPPRANILVPRTGTEQSARASLASGDFAAASRQFGREFGSRTGEYTIQLLTACRDETVQKAVDSAGNSSRLFILPATVEGRRCYRVYWGTYPTQTRAQEALRREVPQPFRKERSQPRVTRLGGA